MDLTGSRQRRAAADETICGRGNITKSPGRERRKQQQQRQQQHCSQSITNHRTMMRPGRRGGCVHRLTVEGSRSDSCIE